MLRQVADDAAEGAEKVGRDFVRRAESAERSGRETLREAESTLKEAGSDAQQALQDFGAKLRSQGELVSPMCCATWAIGPHLWRMLHSTHSLADAFQAKFALPIAWISESIRISQGSLEIRCRVSMRRVRINQHTELYLPTRFGSNTVTIMACLCISTEPAMDPPCRSSLRLHAALHLPADGLADLHVPARAR